MPEWKSFTLGDDGAALPAPEASVAPAMEADEYAAKWDTEVKEFSISRVEEILQGDGLPHGSGEFIAVTELEGERFQIHREPAQSPWAQVETRIALPGAESKSIEELTEVANQWNLSHLQPTLFPIEDGNEKVMIAASRFFVGEGLSDRQIHVMVRRALVVGVSAAKEVPSLVAGSGSEALA